MNTNTGYFQKANYDPLIPHLIQTADDGTGSALSYLIHFGLWMADQTSSHLGPKLNTLQCSLANHALADPCSVSVLDTESCQATQPSHLPDELACDHNCNRPSLPRPPASHQNQATAPNRLMLNYPRHAIVPFPMGKALSPPLTLCPFWTELPPDKQPRARIKHSRIGIKRLVRIKHAMDQTSMNRGFRPAGLNALCPD